MEASEAVWVAPSGNRKLVEAVTEEEGEEKAEAATRQGGRRGGKVDEKAMHYGSEQPDAKTSNQTLSQELRN